MVEYKIDESFLIFEIKGWDKIWSLKGTLKIEIKNVVGVRRRVADDAPPWLRAPGTYLPNIITAGTYYGKGRKEFWCTKHKKSAVVIDLADADYTRIVIDIEDDDIDGLLESVRSRISQK